MHAAYACRLLLLCLVACATNGRAPYVPGAGEIDARARTRYRDVIRQERRGDEERALTGLDRLCADYPDQLGLHLHRLRLARRLKSAEYAASLYEPAPAGVDPARAEILAALARTRPDPPAPRRSLLEFAISREPEEPFWHLGMADVLLTAHDLIIERAERERELGQVKADIESRKEARSVLDDARKQAARAVELDPQLAEAHLMLGYIESRAADMTNEPDQRDELRGKARDRYKEAVKINPDSLLARIDLADAYLYFNDYSGAARELEIAARLAPRDPRVWSNLGYTFHAIGRLDDAIDCYERALEYAPKDIRMRVALSDCERRMGRTKEAVKQLLQAREEAGDDLELRALVAFKLAAIYEFAARYREAIDEYERYIQLGGEEAAKARSRVRYIYEHAFE